MSGENTDELPTPGATLDATISSGDITGGEIDVTAPNSDRLLWEMDSIRTLFNEKRMWPTFVGPKFIQNGTTKITLPVLLWKEQQYCLESSLQPSSAVSGAYKRKRGESSGGETATGCTEGKAAATASDAAEAPSSSGSRNTSNPSPLLTSTTTTTATNTSTTLNDSTTSTSPPPPSKVPLLTPEERTRCLVFRDLHEQGYFLGPADAYGGDYSLYKGVGGEKGQGQGHNKGKGGGDPTQTHSIATVRVIAKGHKITARELLAFSRVQNQVAKSAVLAFSLPPPTAGTGATTSTTTSTATSAAADSSGSCSGSKSGSSSGSGSSITNAETSGERSSEGSTRETSITGSNCDTQSSGTIKSSCSAEGGGSGGVGYIVINFRNVSDRM